MRDAWLDRHKLRSLRKRRGYSVPALARKIGRHYMTLYKVEWGTRRVSPEIYVELKTALNATDADLLTDANSAAWQTTPGAQAPHLKPGGEPRD
ncbi:helix-turn-helix domain-containing protein [Streptomonospora nanhaiensis]|uniref:helix-turn-helix domain-containing protein n=1 Tax=Streptomonospora nanhaiensis TaxID=1323731 RepID=UPI001C385DE5|nr:helix-turn-helix transcriptional regulator [Streptomonospora nanhaiensis]MBV2366938.1 helix-turn-helix domain-containing protein [Streptomonospora nanhaiensis]